MSPLLRSFYILTFFTGARSVTLTSDNLCIGTPGSPHQWDSAESAAGPQPTMDAVFDPANGYLNEANKLTSKVLRRSEWM